MNTMVSRIALMASVFGFSHNASAQDTPLTDIIVSGKRAQPAQDSIDPDTVPIIVPDAANLVARAPGAAISDNGPLSGQVQYHGMSGERVLVRVNGQRFSTGGPNMMDPPMHYAPMVLVDHVELDRSAGPVRSGPSLGGSINAVLKAPQFGTTPDVQAQADMSVSYRTADNSYAMGGLIGIGSENLRLGVIGSFEKGENMRFPGGTIASTSFNRKLYGITAGARSGAHEITLEYRRQEADPSGNPPFPMDIIYVDTDFLRAAYNGQLSDAVAVELTGGFAGVGHVMNNYSLRTPPASMMAYRATFATSDSYTAGGALILGDETNHIRLGGDFDTATKYVRISNPNNADFFIESVDGAESDRIGAYAEWRGALGVVEAEMGLRYDHYSMKAEVGEMGPALPMMPRNLAAIFTATDRQWSGGAVDVIARLWSDLGAFKPRLTLAHKNRAPGVIERFSWLPTEASGGLADGNIYVGDPGLDIERAWIMETGFDWADGSAYIRPTVFYRRVEDYIQGVPYDATVGVIDSPVEMVANMNGDPTPLRFANVGAEFWGADMDFGFALAGPLRLDGVASYVRARRTDINDNLYRIAPPNIRLALGWAAGGWNLALEGVGFADQNHVSLTNDEQPTSGYIIANLLFGVDLPAGLRLDGGVENLFNRKYAEHLAGYNRVMDSDVPLGARLPGAGRSAFIRLSFGM